MDRQTVDQELLLGILALQLGFIDREQLVQCTELWLDDRSRSFLDLVSEAARLEPETRRLLEALVGAHLARHHDDPQESLAALNIGDGVQEFLQRMGSPERSTSPARSSNEATAADPYATLESGSSVDAVDAAPAQHNLTGLSQPRKMVGALSSQGYRFRILRLHARGGLGQVSVARDEELHREVALKEIQERFADHPDSRSRFLMEAEITGGLEHPGIVPVYSLGQDRDGRPFYAMRFIQGDSLRDAIASFHSSAARSRDPGERSLELRKLLGRIIDVCDAMEYAHSRGVVHRDLKPANIMLGRYGETLVVDWGLAKTHTSIERKPAEGDSINPDRPLQPISGSHSEPTQFGSAVGTPAFMSPEQAAGRLDELGPASDIYSLGATLYCLLTGHPPFHDSDLMKLLRKVQRGEFPRPRDVAPHVPPGLEAICLKAMSLRPADRYKSARALAEDIEHWLADEPISAQPDSLMQRLGRWGRRHRAWTQAGALALLVVTIVSTVAAGLVHQSRVEALQLAREKADLALKEQVAHQDAEIRRGEAEAARADAERQRQAAEESRRKAEMLQEEAEENFLLARAAVDKYLTQISEDRRLKAHGLEELRLDLLDGARVFYEEFVKTSPQDLDLQEERGRAYWRLGQIAAEIGRTDEAEKSLLKSVEILEPLSEQQPDDDELSNSIAVSHNALGNLYMKLSRHTEAKSAYARALAIRERLHRRFHDRPLYRRNLAAMYNNLGTMHERARRIDDAEAAFQKSWDILQELVNDHPENTDYKSSMASSIYNLARLYTSVGKLRTAESLHQVTRRLYEEVIDAEPDVALHKHLLARTEHDLGLLYSQTGQISEAEQAHRRARNLRQAVAENHPDVPDYRNELALSENALGSVYWMLRRLDDALAAFHRSAEQHEKLVKEFPALPRFQADLAVTCMNLGGLLSELDRHDEAAPWYERLIGIRRSLAEELTDSPMYRVPYLNAMTAAAWFEHRRGNAEAALARFQAALAEAARLVEQHPGAEEDRIGLGNVQYQAATYQNAVGNVDQAISLYRASLDTRRKLVDEFPDSRERLEDLASSWHSLGFLYTAAKQPEEERRAHEAAIEIYSRLAESHPDVPEYRHGRMQNEINLGWMFDNGGQSADAVRHYWQAIELGLALLVEFPDVPSYADSLGLAWHDLGLAYEREKRAVEATHAYLHAVKHRQPLFDKHPENKSYRDNLAWSRANLGFLYLKHGPATAAVESLQHAATLWRPMELEPTDKTTPLDRAQVDRLTGDALWKLGRHDEALTWFDRSSLLLDRIRDAQPEPANLPAVTLLTHFGRAAVLSEMGRSAEAMAAWDAARKVGDRAETSAAQAARAWSNILQAGETIRSGDWKQGLETLQKNLDANFRETDWRYLGADPARAFALAAARIRADQSLSAEERSERAADALDRAVQGLLQAYDAGYFQTAINIALLERHPDLETLRSRKEFQELWERIRLDAPIPLAVQLDDSAGDKRKDAHPSRK